MGIATSKIYDEYIKSIEDDKRKEIIDNYESKMKPSLDLYGIDKFLIAFHSAIDESLGLKLTKA